MSRITLPRTKIVPRPLREIEKSAMREWLIDNQKRIKELDQMTQQPEQGSAVLGVKA